MKRYYILIETDNADSTFIMENRHYEIYSLPPIEMIASTKNIIVSEVNQSDAFRSLKKLNKNLFKRSSKEFYEKELNLQV